VALSIQFLQTRECLAMGHPQRTFTANVVQGPKRRVLVPLPFAPDEAWGHKPAHPVAGTVDGIAVRAVVEPLDDGWAIVLGPAWRRDCGVAPGDQVDVVLWPEGPQRKDLPEDLVAALDAEPLAGAFFDGLAQFYRRSYLRWIDGASRRPDERAVRIAEVVSLLKSRCQGTTPLMPGSGNGRGNDSTKASECSRCCRSE
jgi:hypothetical protein